MCMTSVVLSNRFDFSEHFATMRSWVITAISLMVRAVLCQRIRMKRSDASL